MEQGQDLQIMTNKNIDNKNKNSDQELNDICEECANKDESVTQNLILLGYKICKSCRISKTIFPI